MVETDSNHVNQKGVKPWVGGVGGLAPCRDSRQRMGGQMRDQFRGLSSPHCEELEKC